MAQSYSPDDFFEALDRGELARPSITLEGLIKPDKDDSNIVQFSMESGCATWYAIPKSIIRNITMIEMRSCKDHQHPYVTLQLASSSENAEAIAFLSLLGAVQRRMSQARPASGGWACGCRGTCKDDTGTGATGYGSTIAEAISDCERRLRLTCLNHQGLKTYEGDPCIET
jgi:hypothetical protein